MRGVAVGQSAMERCASLRRVTFLLILCLDAPPLRALPAAGVLFHTIHRRYLRESLLLSVVRLQNLYSTVLNHIEVLVCKKLFTCCRCLCCHMHTPWDGSELKHSVLQVIAHCLLQVAR
jgi:hypothetical protein